MYNWNFRSCHWQNIEYEIVCGTREFVPWTPSSTSTKRISWKTTADDDVEIDGWSGFFNIWIKSNPNKRPMEVSQFVFEDVLDCLVTLSVLKDLKMFFKYREYNFYFFVLFGSVTPQWPLMPVGRYSVGRLDGQSAAPHYFQSEQLFYLPRIRGMGDATSKLDPAEFSPDGRYCHNSQVMFWARWTGETLDCYDKGFSKSLFLVTYNICIMCP